MRITKGERLILMNQRIIMDALAQVPGVVSAPLHKHSEATEELLEGAHTDSQADYLFRRLKELR